MIEGCPIVGFTGPNGAGKTLVAVTEAIADMRAGRTVVSTVQIDSEHGSSVPLTSLRQLLELEDCTVLLDEVAVVFSSRGSMGLAPEVEVWLQTLRHRNITVRWTAPGWMRADTMLRGVTQVLVTCHPMGKKRAAGVFWPRPLVILAAALDVHSIPQDATPEKILKRRVYVPQRLAGWGAYDTMADTPRVGHPRSGGNCPDCGGSRRAEPCTPDRHRLLGVA